MKRAFLLLAIGLLTALIYLPGLDGPLVFDDAKNLAPLAEWLEGRRSGATVVFDNGSGTFGRPVSMASFVGNVALLGPEIRALKLGNLALHLLNGGLVFGFLSLLVRAGRLGRPAVPSGAWLPLLGAAIWMVHPLFASTVLYVIQRMAMLAAFFTLLTLICYVKGRLAADANQMRHAVGWFAMVPVTTVLAALSKENGILAPALCAVVELCMFVPAVGQRRPWLSKAALVLGLALPAALAIWLVATEHPVVSAGYANRSFTLEERLLTQARVLWSYLGAVVMPHGPSLGLHHDDYRVSEGLLSPATTLVALLAWLATVAGAWRLRRKIPGFALGLGIFLVGHALESSIFPLLIYFEHRNYLPAVGAIWAMLSLAAFGFARLDFKGSKLLPPVVAGLPVLTLALVTLGVSNTWKTEASLLAQARVSHPESRWLRQALFQHALAQSPPAIPEAEAHAGRLMASGDRSTQRLGAVLDLALRCASGRTATPAIIELAYGGRPEPVEPDLLVAFETLGNTVASGNCGSLSASLGAEHLASMLDRSALSPSDLVIWRLRLVAAKLHLASGNSAAAERQARLAWSGGTADAPVALMLAGLLLQREANVEAAHFLTTAESMIASGDLTGMRLLQEYRVELSSRTR